MDSSYLNLLQLNSKFPHISRVCFQRVWLLSFSVMSVLSSSWITRNFKQRSSGTLCLISQPHFRNLLILCCKSRVLHWGARVRHEMWQHLGWNEKGSTATATRGHSVGGEGHIFYKSWGRWVGGWVGWEVRKRKESCMIVLEGLFPIPIFSFFYVSLWPRSFYSRMSWIL